MNKSNTEISASESKQNICDECLLLKESEGAEQWQNSRGCYGRHEPEKNDCEHFIKNNYGDVNDAK